MPDLFFYRDPEEAEKEEQARQESLAAAAAAQAQAAQKPVSSWNREVNNRWTVILYTSYRHAPQILLDDFQGVPNKNNLFGEEIKFFVGSILATLIGLNVPKTLDT